MPAHRKSSLFRVVAGVHTNDAFVDGPDCTKFYDANELGRANSHPIQHISQNRTAGYSRYNRVATLL